MANGQTGTTPRVDVNAELQKILSAEPPQVSLGEGPSLPPLPSAPGEASISKNLQLGRALAVALTQFSQNAPEQTQALLRQFQQQDQFAAQRVQQRFQNAFAVAQEKREGVKFTEAARAQRAQEGRADRRVAVEEGNLKLRAIEASLREIQLEMAREQTENPGSEKVASLAQEMSAVQTVLEQERDRQAAGVGKPNLDPSIQDVVLQGFATPQEINAAVKSGTLGQVFDKFRQAEIARTKLTLLKGNQRLLDFRSTLRNPPAIAAFDTAIEFMPNPATGDPGDPSQFANAMGVLASQNPEKVEETALLLAEKWFSEGSASSMEEAEQYAADFVSNEISLKDIPAPGTFKRGPGLIEKIFSAPGEFLGAGGGAKLGQERAKLELKEKDGTITPKEARRLEGIRRGTKR